MVKFRLLTLFTKVESRNMEGKINFYWQDNMYHVGVEEPTGLQELASWLASDIQYSIESIYKIEKILDDFSNGKRNDAFEGYGNIHFIWINNNYVYIENDYTETKILLNHTQFLNALKQYKVFLLSDYGNQELNIHPFIVEYEADNERAEEIFNNIYNS